MEKIFTNKAHLVWYHDLDEMEKLIGNYLPREGLRKAIAKQGHNYVRANHTFDNRIQQIKKIIEDYEK
jgi:spore maturation protein CgeB